MPIYEYACPRCGDEFERMRKYREREEAPPCPSCGGAARPVMSVTAFVGGATKALPIAETCDAGPACCGGGCQAD